MKPLRLTIAGLHSFREAQEIDFQALTELGLFGIFGPTGSGKSTILDAITLALYGDVARAERNTQAILHHAEKRLSVTFDFAIGAKGQRKQYRVERAYKRGQGFSVEHQASRLLLLESLGQDEDEGVIVIADTKNAVNQAIVGIIGLNESDFTRAVVLPQGKFAEFLQLTGAERNTMMERLFGLERYGRKLTDNVNQRVAKTKEDLRALEASQRELGDASDEAIEQATSVRDEALKQLEKAAKARQQALRQKQEADEVAELLRKQREELTKREALDAKAGDIERMRQALVQSEQAYAVWPLIEAWREAVVNEEQARQTQAQALTKMQSASEILAMANDKLLSVQAKRASEEPQYLQQLGRLQEAMTVEERWHELEHAWQEAKTQYDESETTRRKRMEEREVAAESCAEIAKRCDEAQAMIRDYTISPAMRQRWSALQKAFEAWKTADRLLIKERKAWEERNKKAQAAMTAVLDATKTFEDKQQRVDEANTRRYAIEEQVSSWSWDEEQAVQTWLWTMASQIDALFVVEKETLESTVRWQEASLQCKDLAKQCLDVDEERKALEQHWLALDAVRQARLQLHEQALLAQWTNSLEDGKACPVCGSLHHPKKTLHDAMPLQADHEETLTDEEEARWQQAQAAWREAEETLRQAQRMHGQQETVVAMLAEEVARKQDQNQKLLASLYSHATQRQHETLEEPQIFTDVTAWQAYHARVEAVFAKNQQARKVWEAQCEEHRAHIAALQEELVQAQQVHSLALTLQTAAQEERTMQQQALSMIASEAEQAKLALWDGMMATDLATTIHEAEKPIVTDSIIARLEARFLQVEEADRYANEAQAAYREHYEKWTRAQEQLQMLQEAEKQAQLAWQEKKLHVGSLSQEVADKKAQWQRMTGGIPVKEAMDAVEKALHDGQQLEKTASQALSLAQEQAQAAKEAVVKAQAAWSLQVKAVEVADRQCQEALVRIDKVSVEQVEEALLRADEQQTFTNEVKAFEEARSQNHHRVAEIEKSLAGRYLDEEQVAEIGRLATLSEEQYALSQQRSGSTQQQLDDLMKRHERYQELEAQRLTTDAMAKRLIALQTVLRGNSFVQFVAREQMALVVRQASERLLTLTQGRYALKLTEEGNFLMQDDHNGGITRPVTSLSGGETFLTSLSLALALSAHIQLRGEHPLEFFFLDEGFGTLDPDLLDVVITSLEKLQLDNLVVGLISHVPELRQRMHRRLIVEPALPAGRGTRLKLERA